MTRDDAAICFLTGGSGYVGRNLLRMLTARGTTVRALARSSRSAEVVADLGATPVRGDLADREALRSGMEGATLLVHAAADINLGRMTRAQERASEEQVRLVYTTASSAGIERAIHISTESVLLQGKPLVDANESIPIPDTLAGGYSRTKATAERIARAASDERMGVVVVRPRFVWGRDDTTALPQLIDAARTGKLAWIGGGRYLTSTTHIANLCHGVSLAIDRGRPGAVYFLSDGEPIEFREFVTQMLATQGIEPPQKEIPRWLIALVVRVTELLSTLTGGALRGPLSRQEYATLGQEVTLDITKARTELGYVPPMTREQGLQELREAFDRPSSPPPAPKTT